MQIHLKILIACVLVLSAVNLAPANLTGLQRENAQGAAYVDACATSCKLTGVETQWQNIGWAKDYAEALRLAKESHRPIYVESADGMLEGRT